MIPWGLVWTLAALLLLVVLVLFAIRLVKAFLRVLVDLSNLATTTAKLDAVQATRELERAEPASLVPLPDSLRSYRNHRRDRAVARSLRRQARIDRMHELLKRELPVFPLPRR